MRKNAPLLLLVLLVLGCSPEQPVIEGISDFRLHSFNPLNQMLTVKYVPEIYNPNGISLTVTNVETDIHFDDWHLGTAYTRNPLELRSQERSSVVISQDIRIRDLLPGLRDVVKKDSIRVTLKGLYTFKELGIRASIPHTYQTVIYPKRDLPRLLRELMR